MERRPEANGGADRRWPTVEKDDRVRGHMLVEMRDHYV
jgi:hypothetical protein